MTLVLFFAISTYGATVLSGVVEEKSSRTVEVLLARMPARNLLAGKIVGIGLLGLAQIAAIAVVALVAASLTDSFDVPAVRGSVLVWAVVWFVLGYALFATVFGTLGSLASRTEDASSVTGPVTILLVLGFMVSFAAIGSADTTWAQMVSWLPITAPLAMPNRMAMGAATWWDPLVAVPLTLATIAGLVVLGGRIYTRAILHTGATLSLGEAWRGASPPSRPDGPVTTESTERQEEPAVEQTTTREARTQLVFAVIAIAVGGIVFALTADFVIGVGVGAAVFALARQALKVWGPKGGHKGDAASGPDREPAHPWGRGAQEENELDLMARLAGVSLEISRAPLVPNSPDRHRPTITTVTCAVLARQIVSGVVAPYADSVAGSVGGLVRTTTVCLGAIGAPMRMAPV